MFGEKMTRKSSKGRVLMLLENNSYPLDGRVRREAKSLDAWGYQVTVISPKQKNQVYQETIDNIAVYRYPSPPEADSLLGYLWEYGYSILATFIISWLVLFREGFDVIHAHNPPDTFVLVAAFYKLLGKRFVFDHHDLAPELYYYARFGEDANKFVYKALLRLEQLTLKIADRVIATNESYKAIEMNRGGVAEEKITIVRNGPDLERMRLVDPDPELRSKADFLIGYVGEIGVQDGLDYLLRALWHLIHDLGKTNIYCVVMGDGNALPSHRQTATELDLNKYVGFTGWLAGDDLVRSLSTVDIGVSADPSNPYNDRCTMIKLTEYMAMGKPIVAFDLPENRFTARQAALYAKPNDEFDFAQKIALLMEDPSRCVEMGQFGRRRILSELSWSRQEKHLISVYDSLMLTESPPVTHDQPLYDKD
jgi:glycosyltransferase involved in cell wall biosynthesis